MLGEPLLFLEKCHVANFALHERARDGDSDDSAADYPDPVAHTSARIAAVLTRV